MSAAGEDFLAINVRGTGEDNQEAAMLHLADSMAGQLHVG